MGCWSRPGLEVMSFFHQVLRLDFGALSQQIRAVDSTMVRRTLDRRQLQVRDVPVLVSPAAMDFLPEITHRAASVTRQRFGRVVGLYAPLYLSNECSNRCTYCGFASDQDIRRRSLSTGEALQNAVALHDMGFRHLLLVTGESPRSYGVSRVRQVVDAVARLFPSVSIEIFPLSISDYRNLATAGVDGLAIYQETYDRQCYARVHPAGRKADYQWRLEAPERAARAGYRSIGIGALIGLADWRAEATVLALHAAYLARHFWRSRIALSFPRLVDAGRVFRVEHPVGDLELIQMMASLRLVLPDAEIVLSTRESPAMRDLLVGCCVTRMSAGSKTSPGGYVLDETGEQFKVTDDRPPALIAHMLREKGLDPVWKDFDAGFR